jgi:HK97 family phage major capsid protein
VPYNNTLSRSDTAALVPEEYIADLITEQLPAASIVLSAEPRRVPLSRAQARYPVLNLLPTAYFVNGDTGLKQTTEAAWANKYINVEELAVIVPVPENVIEDVGFDLVNAMTPLIVQALGQAIDAAVLFGVNKPTSWDLGDGATANGIFQVAAAKGKSFAATGTAWADFLGMLKLTAEDGYPASAIVGDALTEFDLLGVTDTLGRPLFIPDTATTGLGALAGRRFVYLNNGIWNSTDATVIAGDWSNMIVGMRRDITFQVFTEGVITDNTGAVVLNLMQQDSRALRVTMRLGVTVAMPINARNAGNANRYPFAVLAPAGGHTL